MFSPPLKIQRSLKVWIIVYEIQSAAVVYLGGSRRLVQTRQCEHIRPWKQEPIVDENKKNKNVSTESFGAQLNLVNTNIPEYTRGSVSQSIGLRKNLSAVSWDNDPTSRWHVEETYQTVEKEENIYPKMGKIRTWILQKKRAKK